MSLVPVDDASAGKVIGAQLYNHAVFGEDTDVVLAHLARDVSKYDVTVIQFHPEHRIWKGLDDRTLDLDDSILLRNVPPSARCYAAPRFDDAGTTLTVGSAPKRA